MSICAAVARRCAYFAALIVTAAGRRLGRRAATISRNHQASRRPAEMARNDTSAGLRDDLAPRSMAIVTEAPAFIVGVVCTDGP